MKGLKSYGKDYTRLYTDLSKKKTREQIRNKVIELKRLDKLKPEIE